MSLDPADFRRLLRDSWDQCSECGARFTEETRIVLGRRVDGTPVRVGECCAYVAHYVAANLRWEPRAYEVPPRSARLWRYLDFPKYVALLRDQALFFSRADCLGDRFELAKGLVERKHVWDEYHLDWYREVLRNPPAKDSWSTTDEAVEKRAQELLREQDAWGLHELQATYVSCWHENDTESEALWRLYCGAGAGVALQATLGSLLVALRDSPDIAVGRVRYIDFRHEFAGVNDAVFCKRSSLSHEREVRAVHRVFHGERPQGVNIAIPIGELVERVVISPLSPSWFLEVVRETTCRFGTTFQIEASELLLEPFY